MRRKRVVRSADVDANSFQRQVEMLAITLTHKVEREGIRRLQYPDFAVTDLGVILRQATYTYDLLFFLHSDQIREGSAYRQEYSIAALPLIRTMIDCLYNITAILDDPGTRSPAFRKSGYAQLLRSLDEETRIYSGQPEWDDYLRKRKDDISIDMRSVNIKESECREMPLWPTLSQYIRAKKGKELTLHQNFLKTLTFGYWAEYSSISHATFPGLKATAPFFLKDRTPHHIRDFLEDRCELFVSQHLARAAGILLCIVTELQIYFRFEGARIGDRIDEAWKALNVFLEVKELYERRYAELLSANGISSCL